MAKGLTTASNAIDMRKQEAQWAVESDLRTLIEAEKIEADPKRFKAAKALAKKQLDALKAITSDTD